MTFQVTRPINIGPHGQNIKDRNLVYSATNNLGRGTIITAAAATFVGIVVESTGSKKIKCQISGDIIVECEAPKPGKHTYCSPETGIVYKSEVLESKERKFQSVRSNTFGDEIVVPCVEYSGRIRLESVKINYAHLVRFFAEEWNNKHKYCKLISFGVGEGEVVI